MATEKVDPSFEGLFHRLVKFDQVVKFKSSGSREMNATAPWSVQHAPQELVSRGEEQPHEWERTASQVDPGSQPGVDLVLLLSSGSVESTSRSTRRSSTLWG